MKIIKLDAIDSTNSFLKDLAQNSPLSDYTVAVTKEHTAGRGQMNNSWASEPNKNLTFSIFTTFKNLRIQDKPYLNFAVALAIFDTLQAMAVPNVAIKWPNDIMSGNHKICGILVETTFKHQKIKNAIVGIGLNVNQEEFPAHISQASSLKRILKKEFDLEEIMHRLIEKIQSKITSIEHSEFESIHQEYLNNLYKKDVPTAFKSEQTGQLFMGIIKDVTTKGNLRIQLEDDSVVEFGIKEISIARA